MSSTHTPPPPKALSEHHWRLLLSIADGFAGVDDHDDAGIRICPSDRPLSRNPSECTAFTDLLRATIEDRIPAKTVGEVRLFLSLVGGPAAYLLNGRWENLYDLPRSEVEKVLLGWQGSMLKPIRTGAASIGFLLRILWLKSVPDVEKAMNFPGHRGVNGAGAGAGDDDHDVTEPTPTPTPQDDMWSQAVASEYQGEQVKQLSTGILVVGSGSGASAFVNALVRDLKTQGFKSGFSKATDTGSPELEPGPVADILIVEKGIKVEPHTSTESIPLSRNETQAITDMWENAGILSSQEGALNVIAGSTWGGGSRVNWSACLQTDRKVREEWTKSIMGQAGRKDDADPHGRMFMSGAWQDCMERIEQALGVQTPSYQDHNAANRILVDGARRLGYSCRVVPQNLGGALADHSTCGASCTIGCRAYRHPADGKGKISGDRLLLRHMADTGAEAEGIRVRGMDKVQVDRVIFEGDRAVGATAWVERRGKREKLVIRAERVVVSGGSLHTPALLLRSGVQNPHLGRHLHCHPCVIVQSSWPSNTEPWAGTILTSVIDEFSNLDGRGHGVKLICMDMIPSLAGGYTPWAGSADWRARMAAYPRTMGHLVLCRDTGPGRVFLDADSGEMRFSYVPGVEEKKWLTEGFVGLAKLLHTMGAEEIYTHAAGLPIWRRQSQSQSQPQPEGQARADWAEDESFLAFLAAYEKYNFEPDRMALGSAHQMGTCRMSGTPSAGVVDTRGRVWGKRGLYVADASVFPSASGVNPMITVMAFGEWIGGLLAQEIVQETKTAPTTVVAEGSRG